MNYSLSQEEEAKQITSIAIKALPIGTDGVIPSVAIFEADSPLEHRIADYVCQTTSGSQYPLYSADTN